jgi:hypothetical protein
MNPIIAHGPVDSPAGLRIWKTQKRPAERSASKRQRFSQGIAMLKFNAFQMTPWFERSPLDRRNDAQDRRIQIRDGAPIPPGKDKRKTIDRRKGGERRERWMRINRWQSIPVFDE